MGQGNNYGDGGTFCATFMAPKGKYCLTINEKETIEKKTYKDFQHADRFLDRKQYFDLIAG